MTMISSSNKSAYLDGENGFLTTYVTENVVNGKLHTVTDKFFTPDGSKKTRSVEMKTVVTELPKKKVTSVFHIAPQPLFLAPQPTVVVVQDDNTILAEGIIALALLGFEGAKGLGKLAKKLIK